MTLDGSQLAAIILAIGGAIVAAWATSARPTIAIGTLFMLASLSRLVVETPIGTMRIEQPAIALVAVVLVGRGGLRALRSLSRTEILFVAGLAAYVGALTASSVAQAPKPVDSLRMVAWLVISMVGGAVVYRLARRVPETTVWPSAVAGATKAATGLVVATLFLIMGPSADWGVQEALGALPRVHAFTWEANLYASFLGITIPFAMEAVRRPQRRLGMAVLALVVIGLPLGATRGAYMGAAAGVIAYASIRLVLERRPADLLRVGGLGAVAMLIGLFAADFLLPNALERYLAHPPPAPSASATLVVPSGALGNGGPTLIPRVTANPIPTQGPPPSIQPYPDTISFRLDRVPVAIEDLSRSPLIGLGADSFGQRHLDSSQAGSAPDHLAILAIAVVYESGVVGATSLGLAFLLLLCSGWSSARTAAQRGDREHIGLAAAGVGSVIAMLVAYQATAALHFGSTWVIIGAAAAIAFAQRNPAEVVTASTTRRLPTASGYRDPSTRR